MSLYLIAFDFDFATQMRRHLFAGFDEVRSNSAHRLFPFRRSIAARIALG
jgi:hypothetical protein